MPAETVLRKKQGQASTAPECAQHHQRELVAARGTPEEDAQVAAVGEEAPFVLLLMAIDALLLTLFIS